MDRDGLTIISSVRTSGIEMPKWERTSGCRTEDLNSCLMIEEKMGLEVLANTSTLRTVKPGTELDAFLLRWLCLKVGSSQGSEGLLV
jgi:hypothetical protein